MSHLSFDASGQVATTTLRNPPQNRLSVPMLDEFAQALDAIGTSEARAGYAATVS
jgi:enoyl-CoA hydratase/carnithine racemase